MTATETTPELVIRELAPDRLGDFLRFFDRDAFADNPAWASCYCHFYHLACSDEEWAARGGADNRAATSALIRQGRARGWLAYAGDRPVGWCHAAPRHTLPRLTLYDGLPPDDGGVGAIVCFVVAPAYRRHGVASRLLAAACDGFRRDGLRYVEAYPLKETAAIRSSDAHAYRGPLAMYRAAGFEPVAELEHYVVVRKALGRSRQPGVVGRQ